MRAQEGDDMAARSSRGECEQSQCMVLNREVIGASERCCGGSTNSG